MTYIIILSYIGITFILALCFFAYCCSCHNCEVCMDEDDIFNMIVGFILLPIRLIKPIITSPFKLIMKYYNIK